MLDPSRTRCQSRSAHSILRERGPEDEARCVGSSRFDKLRMPGFTSSDAIQSEILLFVLDEEISLTLLVQKGEQAEGRCVTRLKREGCRRWEMLRGGRWPKPCDFAACERLFGFLFPIEGRGQVIRGRLSPLHSSCWE